MIFIFVALANISAEKINFVHISSTLSHNCHVIAYIIAIIAGVTDLLDGYLARKYGWVSDFGALMDPLADKIFITATFIMMVDYKLMPAWITVVVLSREFLVTGLRLLATQKGEVISADRWGKLKTFLQMLVLLIGGASWINLFGFDLLSYGAESLIWKIWYSVLVLIALITVSSGCGYFIRHRNLYSHST
jgi:CDP-diacylglycerol--glycerol-3-phosphate 3-phosphatidyltransferase